MRIRETGFTLIEVLIALVIISVAFSALLGATAISIHQTYQLKEKTVKHWIASQGMSMIQLGLVDVSSSGSLHTFETTMFHQTWYWRVALHGTPIRAVSIATITLSTKKGGPYTQPFYAFHYHATT